MTNSEHLSNLAAREAASGFGLELSIEIGELFGHPGLAELLKLDTVSAYSLYSCLALIALDKGLSGHALSYIKRSIMDTAQIPGSTSAFLRRLALVAFKSNDVQISINCFELLVSDQRASRTPKIILASLYFRKAHTLRIAEENQEEAIQLYVKSYSLRSDLFELFRIYRFRSDLELSSEIPARLDDLIEPVEEFVDFALRIFYARISNINSKLYSMLRFALRMAKRFSELELIANLYLHDSTQQARNLISISNYQASYDVLSTSLALHASLALDPKVVLLYELLGVSAGNLRKPKEAEYASRLALAAHNRLPDLGDLATEAQYTQRDNTLVLCFLSSKYFEMFDEWLKFFNQHDLPNLLVVALDVSAYENLKSRRIPCILRSLFSYQSDFFFGTDFLLVKILIIAELLHLGINVLCTGVDSIWLSNPFENSEIGHHDIFAMGLPSSVMNWRINLNTDFMYLRSSPSLKSLLPAYIDNVKRLVNDQTAFNLTLSQSGTKWTKTEDGAWKGICKEPELKIFLTSPTYCTRDRSLVDSFTLIYQPPSSLGYSGKLDAIKDLSNLFFPSKEALIKTT